MTATAAMIEVKGLNFEYGFKRVLHDINFSIRRGSVTALVGPNGAGKTTLMRCVTGLSLPVTGDVFLDGIDLFEKPREAHRMIGFVGDVFGAPPELTVQQTLTYAAGCHHIPRKEIPARVEAMAAKVGLQQYYTSSAGKLSRGYQQRLGIAHALIHDPKIIILDEPAAGMDPEARIKLSQLMLELRTQGKTIIVSSHILNELEDYCTDMLVMRDGRIMEHVVLENYQANSQARLRLKINGDAKPYMQSLAAVAGVSAIAIEGGDLCCTFQGSTDDVQKLLAKLITDGVPLLGFSSDTASLADAYMNITKQEKTNEIHL